MPRCSIMLTYVECQLSTTELLNEQPFDIFLGLNLNAATPGPIGFVQE